MMNQFRIDLGFLPQHLPQQIKFVTEKAKGAREPRANRRTTRSDDATASQTLADLGQCGATIFRRSMLTIARKPSHPPPAPPFEAMGPHLTILRVLSLKTCEQQWTINDDTDLD